MTEALCAHRCPNGHLTVPGHARCPHCGREQTETFELEGETGTVVTWTTSTATPTGVREPNTLAVVEFDLGEAGSVRTIGATTGAVETGEAVRPVHVAACRDPETAFRVRESQTWDGFRFEPVD